MNYFFTSTEGQAFIAWSAASRLPVFSPGTKPFTVSSSQSSPEEDPLPSSIKVSPKPFLNLKLFETLAAAFSFLFNYKTQYLLTGKIPRHARPHLVQWNNVPHPPSLHQPSPHPSRNQLSLQQDPPPWGRGTPSPRICVLSRLCLHSRLTPARPKTKMVSYSKWSECSSQLKLFIVLHWNISQARWRRSFILVQIM